MKRFLTPYRTLGVLMLGAFTLGVFGLLTTPVPAQEATETNQLPRPVILMTAQAANSGVTRQFFGQVVARQTVDLAFQVGGQIVQLPANEGTIIPQGDLIAELDLEPFELQLQQAELQADQAQRAFERLSQLTISVTQAQLEDAETQLGLSRVAVRNAQFELDNATLVAPFDALVANRNVANFTTVSAGNPVVRLHDMSELRIDIDVPEVVFQRSADEDDLTLEAIFPSSDAVYPLEVREFNAEASSVGQSFRATLALPDPNGLNALPGSSVTVQVTVGNQEDAIPIPATALKLANDGSASVLRFVSDDGTMGLLEEVAVDVEADREGLFLVVSGLETGDEIVRTGAHLLQDGQQVRRFAGFSN